MFTFPTFSSYMDTVSQNTNIVVKILVHHSVKYFSRSCQYLKCLFKFRSPPCCMKLLSKIKMALRHETCCVLLTNLFNWLIVIKLGVKYRPLEDAQTNFYTSVIHLQYCTSILGGTLNRVGNPIHWKRNSVVVQRTIEALTALVYERRR